MAQIELYTGEFLVSPVPLQLSLNYCSHNCSYCFANLNKPDRKADAKTITGQLRNFMGQNNLVAQLLRDKYPVLISNLVDPFATSNYALTVPIIEQLHDLGIPVALQTRGAVGKNAMAALDHVLSFLPKTLWYISIPTIDDEVRKKIEPAAPSVGYRLELLDRLTEAEHPVIVGANPSEWIWNPKEYLDVVGSHGGTHYWTEPLHLNHEQLRNMRPWARQALGEDLIQSLASRQGGFEHKQFAQLYEIIRAAHEADDDIFSIAAAFATDFMDIYADAYGDKVFPTVSQFLYKEHQALESTLDEVPIDIERFIEYCRPFLPQGTYHMPGYFFNKDRDYYVKNPTFPKKMSFETLLRGFWNLPRAIGISNYRECTQLVEGFMNGLKSKPQYHLDGNGNMVYHFMWEGFDDRETITHETASAALPGSGS